jgi:hypothetical protein
MPEDNMQLPAWVEAALKLGVPGGIAVFLVWRLAGGFDVVNDRLKEIEAQHASIAAHSERVEDLMGNTFHSSERAVMILRVMCANAAKNEESRERCLQP